MSDYKIDTRVIHAGQEPDPTTGAVITPIYATSTYAQQSPGVHKGYDYARSHNLTRYAYERCVADLEGGVGAVITASGMAAVTLVAQLFRPDDLAVVPHDCYGGSWRLFNALAKKGAFELITCDLTDPRALAEALQESPALVWISST